MTTPPIQDSAARIADTLANAVDAGVSVVGEYTLPIIQQYLLAAMLNKIILIVLFGSLTVFFTIFVLPPTRRYIRKSVDDGFWGYPPPFFASVGCVAFYVVCGLVLVDAIRVLAMIYVAPDYYVFKNLVLPQLP